MGSNDPNYYDATTGRMLDLDVLRGIFDEAYDATYDEVEAMGTRLKASAFLRAADRPAYDQAFHDWADGEVKARRLSVGPPEVEWGVVLDIPDSAATSAVDAARKVAAQLAGKGADGYAWRAVYDVTGPDGTEHQVDLEMVGSGRTCLACGSLDDGHDGEMWADDQGRCTAKVRGRLCGGRMEWMPDPEPEPEMFTCMCGEHQYPLVKTDEEESLWCDCGKRIDEQRAEAQRRKDAS